MLQLIKAGGVPAIVILILGIVTIGTAIAFVRRPGPGHLAVARAVNSALTWTIIFGVASNLMTVARFVGNDPEMSKAPGLPLMMGIGESLSPLVIGGAILTISWIILAFGLRKMESHAS
jgi:hypothetical protein